MNQGLAYCWDNHLNPIDIGRNLGVPPKYRAIDFPATGWILPKAKDIPYANWHQKPPRDGMD